MSNKLKIHLISISIILLIFFIGWITVNSSKQQNLVYISSFGFLALLSIIFVLFIPLLVKIKRNNFTVNLLINRRWLGIYTFIFALIHVFLVYNFFFNWDLTKASENIYTNLGLISILILALMAITSNNKSIKLLGKNWKRLHYLIYAVLILIIFHSFKLGQIFIKEFIVKVIVILLIVFAILGKLFYSKLVKKDESIENKF